MSIELQYSGKNAFYLQNVAVEIVVWLFFGLVAVLSNQIEAYVTSLFSQYGIGAGVGVFLLFLNDRYALNTAYADGTSYTAYTLSYFRWICKTCTAMMRE